MDSLTIAVSGLNAVDSPGPGVSVLRSLKASNLNAQFIGLAYDVLEPGNFMSGLIEASFIIPYPSSGAEDLFLRLMEIHKRKAFQVIVPTLDSEIDNYIQIQDRLKEKGIHLFIPGSLELHLRDKTVLADSMKKVNISMPQTIILGDVPALNQAEQKLSYPFYLKGLYYEAYLVKNNEEALAYFYKISSKWGLPVIAQEFIQGEESNVAAIALQGETFGSVAMKKMFVTDKGKAWAGVTIKNSEISELSKIILKSIAWNGGCELEYIIEAKTGKIYLLEINPRFPAWIYLATAAGQNLPEMAVKLALGQKVQALNDYEVGKVFVRHSWDEIVPMEAISALSTGGEFYLQNEL